MKYLFGPVNSRRLGMSLGVDLVPFKTCSLNCVYCECGDTRSVTSVLAEYVPVNEVISELDAYLSGFPRLDVITFSGSGEPTLHSGIGRIIGHLKEKYPQYKIAVLTNGTMLGNPEVRESIGRADIVIPSLDAVSPDIFSRIARPAPDITPERVIRGLEEFRKEFGGEIFLEIFIVPGLNDGKDELQKLKEACLKIRPDRVQINSLDRPGAEAWVMPVDSIKLADIKDFFKPLDVEIIGRPAARTPAGRHVGDLDKSIIALLRRRPSTLEDMCVSLGSDRASVQKAVASMMEKGMLAVESLERGEFYRLA
jgi:wyosine [tRNA(Phe)-imidazoG37] synthetase (radical SAM superfamily)